MKAATKGIIIAGVIIAIVTAVVSPLADIIGDAITLPRPVPSAASQSTSLCMKDLGFREGNAPFSFTYINKGEADGSFTAVISSNEVNSKFKDSNKPFEKTSGGGWYTDAGETQSFRFILELPDASNPPDEITIETTLVCKKFLDDENSIPCGTPKRTCEYQKTDDNRFGYQSYDLVN